jgi:hypothetical protein
MNKNEYKLSEEIIALSIAKSWDAAKLEWVLHEVYMADEPDQCLCGHFPIIEMCILKNKKNSKKAVVGNCCVKKFLGLRSDKIFQSLKKVKRDNAKSFNPETIDHAFNNRWITSWDRKFYFDIWRLRSLSQKQMEHKLRINRMVLHRFSART